jgi:hypothetical protein
MSNPIYFSMMEPPEIKGVVALRTTTYFGNYYNDPVSTPGGSGFIVSPASVEAVDTAQFNQLFWMRALFNLFQVSHQYQPSFLPGIHDLG